MAPKLVQIDAFSLYLHHAEEKEKYEKITELLKEKHKNLKISVSSVRRWAETPDENGETWKDKRQSVLQEVRREKQQVFKSHIAEMEYKSGVLWRSIYDNLTGENAPKLKSYEGAVYAAKTMMEFNMLLKQKNQDEISPAMIIDLILEIFQSDPKFCKLLKARWSFIETALQKRMSEFALPEKVINVSPEKD
ncbi:MAG TPA: hypothetical protein PK453_27875 [Leptospiraceae bacterium]|nr:hypothetical protein [Leptospiraceae bacterium]HNF28166.1 hypothetical protein [Leptospiraceae bacterium]HNI99935.1 hypothetical protein [Leptospiraceae bacterium]HNM06925.1 hypothetical protein [Leptospiraceae bacterium]